VAENNAVSIVHSNVPAVVAPGELSVEQVLAQVEKIQILMQKAMHKDEHYGVIPGTPKPTLLKAGAEKLCLMFRLDPEYEITERQEGEHLTILSRCTLYHITTGARMGSGMGSCSTRESKYAYRKSGRACPSCGVEGSIQRSKFGNKGWYCYLKLGGCDAKFEPNDPKITEQKTDRVANPDLADQYNTILKMANKRSLIAGVLNVTAASDIFTQDLEDLADARKSMGSGAGGDSDGKDGGNPDNQEPKTVTEAQQNMLRAKAADTLGLDEAGLVELAGVEITQIRADAVDALLGKIAEAGARPITPDEGFDLAKEIETKQIEPAKVLQFFNKDDFEKFTFGDYNRAMRMIRARKTQAAPTTTATPPREPGDEPPNGDSSASAPRSVEPVISDKQGKRLYAIAKGDADLLRDVLSRYGYEHSRDIPRSEYDAICKDVEKAVSQ
jgi:hypothetical protein